MEDGHYYSLGDIDGTELGVQHTLNGQDILIQQSDVGQSLACLLAFGKVEMHGRGETYFWRIAHTREVDALLLELIDLFISIRYAHPTMVQLKMILESDQP